MKFNTKLFTYLKFFIGFLILSLCLGIFEEGFKLITTIFSISHDLIYSEENMIARLFLEKHQYYSNVVQEIFFRLIKVLLMLYILLKFVDFKSIIPDLKNRIFFTTKNRDVFKQLGNALIVYSIIKFVVKILERILKTHIEQEFTSYDIGHVIGVSIGASIGERIPILIMGLFLLIIANLLGEGLKLKQENDLTI